VSFPSPALAGTEAGHMRVVDLKHFMEMKLASGMTAPHRLQDLADVLRLIAVAKLPRELSETPILQPASGWLATRARSGCPPGTP
jgi:hypothetical protein